MGNKNDNIWHHYYQKALTKKHAPRTEFCININKSSCKVAVDIGCGTGGDIAYLANEGYQVYGVDINAEAIAICHDRFANNELVSTTRARFENYDYPRCGIVIANASLFFAEPTLFQITWQGIVDSIAEGGVFAGDFMGLNDSWAVGYRSATTPLTRLEVEALFSNFEIIRFHERDELGKTSIGKTKHWHTFSVVAVKRTC